MLEEVHYAPQSLPLAELVTGAYAHCTHQLLEQSEWIKVLKRIHVVPLS